MKYAALLLIRIYQMLLSPMLHTLVPIRSGCRFPQPCSEYMAVAIQRNGIISGIRHGFARLVRCHPFSLRVTR